MNMSDILQNSLSHTNNVYHLFFSSGASMYVSGPLGGVPHEQNTLPLTANRTDRLGNILGSIVFDPNAIEFFFVENKD